MEEQSNAQSSASQQDDSFEIVHPNKKQKKEDIFEIPDELLWYVHPRFAGLPRFSLEPESRSDWTDDRLLNLKGIVLRRYDSPTQLAPIVKEGLASLQGTVTRRTIGAIMVSAWNLYYIPEGKYVFPEIPTNTTPDDEEFTAFDQSPITTNPNNPDGAAEILWPLDDSATCCVGAYVCDCLLRLATKPPSNFLKSWGNIKNRYWDFNKRRFVIRGLNPVEGNLEAVRMVFSYWSPFKETLSRFVYHFNELRGNVKGLARFAFEQHLSLTGLHGYHLFRRVADKLEANQDDLIVALYCTDDHYGLEMIYTIFQNFEGSNDEKQRRQTWRYARLFDHQMFAHLQTKKCRVLTSILAMILKEIGDDQGGDGDVSQIEQIRGTLEYNQDRFQKIASEVIQKFAKRTG
ncbi:uncharacterized protein LOC107429404 isoform X1 [Ziziphus jujuba]|uniref:Uncharacterized protein LOC107429404 isoform X1 n=2 Tax=Ziziphus jujuba TaxID=326968 RepID=A0A6P4B195_ZIZJJ|nr:uncharacterized protein LOC107429404 isoform X1 [Ziziphus jujuba]